MRRVLVAGSLVIAAQLARADHLWTEKSGEEAKRDMVVLPSMGPLVRKARWAVVNITTNGKDSHGAPGGSHPDGDPLDELFRRFHGGERPPPSRGMGTGFLIHPTGYILTNHHVVEESEAIEVRLVDDDTPRTAKVIGSDEATDVALIKIDGTNLPVLSLGDSDALEVGDFVLAIGNPFGLEHSASFGMVSAKGRREINPSGRPGLYDFIQTDAAINPGNSGGPLINLRGEVIGINAAINAVGQGIGFAIPINMAKQMLPDLKSKGLVTRSWLGISIQKVTPELAQSFGLDATRGALVSQVYESGPSAGAGLEPGDVIVEFDGKKIAHSSDLPLLAAAAGVGKAVPLKYLRDGKERTAKVTLTARPTERALRGVKSAPVEATDLGVKVVELDGALRHELGLQNDFRGVIVKEVDPLGPAASAGVKKGDIVVKLNGKAVPDVPTFVTLARQARPGQMVRLFVRRGDAGMFLAFKL
jgi:serine protease Do